MSNNQSTLHYLPVEVSGQVFAIPMSEVTAIRQLSGDDVSSSSEAVSTEQVTIPIVNLQSLFFGIPQTDAEQPAYVIIISIPPLTCAVLVDSVRPARRVEEIDQLAMPFLLSGERYPFRGAIRTPDGLVLIIDAHRMAEELRQAKPDLIVEKAHGS